MHQAGLGVLATRNEDVTSIFIATAPTATAAMLSPATNTATNTDISHDTTAALLLGYYTVMGLLLCGVGCRWE